jgi:hypothetical protein
MTQRDLMDIAKASQEAARLDAQTEAFDAWLAEASQDDTFCCIDCECGNFLYSLEDRVQANEEVLYHLGV